MELLRYPWPYTVRKLTEGDIDDIYALSLGNPMFFQYCPPAVTRQSIREDMEALPPGKTLADKYYVGFWDGKQLVAVLDLILSHPDAGTAWVGLFMVERAVQGQGVGSRIVSALCDCLHTMGYDAVSLAYAKGNGQSKTFWEKQGFTPTGEERPGETYTAVVLRRNLP